MQILKPLPAEYREHYSWQPGDTLTGLENSPLSDILDLYFYLPETEMMTLSIQRQDGTVFPVTLPTEALATLTACLAPPSFRCCACHCVFCFVDQNPPGMRSTIYLKDEDYRFSFLYGNYVTLSSLGTRGRQRILDLQLSPLFVSVHVTDDEVRGRLLGRRRGDDILGQLRTLCAGGITVHTQIVLCPGWNDGELLERSVRDLLALAPGVASLAIVPVGLTRYRTGLTKLEPVTPALAREVVTAARVWQKSALATVGTPFVHLSDEFYLLADEPFPAVDRYDDFPQVDTGVGMTVQLRECWRQQLRQVPEAAIRRAVPITVVTGEAAARAFSRDLIPVWTGAGLPPPTLVTVPNHFYGQSVTVAGLLTGQDLRQALETLPPEQGRPVLLPPAAFNADGRTLDDWHLESLGACLSHRLVVLPEEGLVDFWLGMD
ncbi:MAG: DUF512 domain-containing protein [bacterium]